MKLSLPLSLAFLSVLILAVIAFAVASTNDPFVASHNFSIEKVAAGLADETTPRFNYSGQKKFEDWAGEARPDLIHLLGLPLKRVDLKAVSKRQGKFTCTSNDGREFTYSRDVVQFFCQDKVAAFGYLLLPEGRKGRLPCIICIPGHGGSVENIIGVDKDGSTRKRYSLDYQHDLAVQAVSHGFAVLAIDVIGSGHMQNPKYHAENDIEGQCRQCAMAALMAGQSLMGWNVNEVMRGIDYLQVRPEIDPQRIGILGCSRGGAIALYSAAVDTRIKCAGVSCYLNTWKSSVLARDHCPCNFVPGMLLHFKMSDIAGLIAPRYLFCEGNADDVTFPYAGAKEAFDEAAKIFSDAGSADRITFSKGTGFHIFRGEDIFQQFKAHL